MDAIAIRAYDGHDRTAVRRALTELQDYEVPLNDSRLPGEPTTGPYFEGLLRDLQEHTGAMFVAEVAGAIVGIAACLVVEDDLVQETPDSNRHGYVEAIFVDPRYRGQGVAQRLLVAAEQHLVTTGVTRLRINVLANHTKARRAYERYGFAPYEVMYERRIG